MEISMIVAMARNRIIGRGGCIPWRLRDDQRNFRRVTMGKPLIMGRKTHESIGKVLDGRLNIVLTTQPGYTVTGGRVARSPADALVAAGDASEVMVIGGEAVYAAFLPKTHRIHLTLVHTDAPGDARFPAWEAADWTEVHREDHPADADNDHPYTYRILTRKPASDTAV